MSLLTTVNPPPTTTVLPVSPLPQLRFQSQISAFPALSNSCSLKLSYVLPSRLLLSPIRASVSEHPYAEQSGGDSIRDPELRTVLELATDTELYEIEEILYGQSYFSPVLKSITKRVDVDYVMMEQDPEERKAFISMLESRFFYLAADARSTLRGWRPSYRNVLLAVRKKLNIHCSSKLSTEDLEIEIFLYLLQEYSRGDDIELGLSRWKLQTASALRIGSAELCTLIVKGGGMLTVKKIFELMAGRLSGKMFLEAAKYQMKKEVVKKGGQLAALGLETRAALLAAKQGFKAAATRYLGVRSMGQLLGPFMWGTLLADIVIQMLGTDYARILQAIYAFAQIRIYRSHGISADH